MARKIVLSLTLALFAAFLTIPASATCGLEGLHTSGGGYVSTAGNRGSFSQAGTSGCYIYITNIYAGLVQTGSTANTATIAIYTDLACTSWAYSLQQLAVTSTTGSMSTWEWRGNSLHEAGGTLRIPSGSDLCIGFGAGVAGLIESVAWSGFYSGNIQ